MDVREKLVELLNEVQETGVNEIPAGFGCTREYVKNEMVASHLIANGVTVQEWVPKAEFPWMCEEIAKLCIRYMEDYADFHGYASSKKVKAHIVRLLELEKDGRIAILPQPPKGE